MRKKIQEIREKADNNKYVPNVNSALRASVAAIPFIGGVFDHLLFDKAAEIRVRNIEKAIQNISDKLNELTESSIDREWFESIEAIEMFKQLLEKIEFEQDTEKLTALSDIYAISGTQHFSNDPNKFAVLKKVSELTSIQKKILQIVTMVTPKEKQFDGGGLTSTATLIWLDDIKQAISVYPSGKFWSGTLLLDVEIEIIESLNLLRRINAPTANIFGYQITGLGKLVVRYLNGAG